MALYDKKDTFNPSAAPKLNIAAEPPPITSTPPPIAAEPKGQVGLEQTSTSRNKFSMDTGQDSFVDKQPVQPERGVPQEPMKELKSPVFSDTKLIDETYNKRLTEFQQERDLMLQQAELKRAKPQLKQIPDIVNFILLGLDAYTGKPEWLHHLVFERPAQQQKIDDEYNIKKPLLDNEYKINQLNIGQNYEKAVSALNGWKEAELLKPKKSITNKITQMNAYESAIKSRLTFLKQKAGETALTPEEQNEANQLSGKLDSTTREIQSLNDKIMYEDKIQATRQWVSGSRASGMPDEEIARYLEEKGQNPIAYGINMGVK